VFEERMLRRRKWQEVGENCIMMSSIIYILHYTWLGFIFFTTHG
jgi:hypothetical protein